MKYLSNSYKLFAMSELQELVLNNDIKQLIQGCYKALEGFGISLQEIAQELKNVNSQVLKNIEQISSSNNEIKTLRQAIIAAEISIDQICTNLDFSYNCTEVLLTGLPEDCSLDNQTIVFNFLNKIGAGYLTSHILNIRQFKANNQKSDQNYNSINLVIKFSSSQVRKFVMDLKRRHGKITFQDILNSAFICHSQANKKIYVNDLLSNELYTEYQRVKKHFQNNKDVYVYSYKGAIFAKLKGQSSEPIIPTTDLENLFNLF